MGPRTLFAWLFIFVLIAAGVFFTYHIVDVAGSTPSTNGLKVDTIPAGHVVPRNAMYENPVHFKEPAHEVADIFHAEPLDMPVEPPKPMPVVVGQTEEDLRATRQVIETPPPVEYSEPEAKDPMETVANSESEFGDNLRHPEQTIEIHPPMGTMRVPAAGLGSDEPPSMGAHQSAQYAPEMAQNGGEFMSGIFAFDGSDIGSGTGIGFSMI